MWEIRFLPVFIKGLLYTGLGIRLWFATSLSKNQRLAQKKKIVVFTMTVFTAFSLFMPKSKSLLSLFALLLFTKKRLWAIHSCHSLKKSDSLKKLKSEFPTLDIISRIWYPMYYFCMFVPLFMQLQPVLTCRIWYPMYCTILLLLLYCTYLQQLLLLLFFIYI